MNLPFSHDAFLEVVWHVQHAALASRGGALGRSRTPRALLEAETPNGWPSRRPSRSVRHQRRARG
jgi:hypothetical protein